MGERNSSALKTGVLVAVGVLVLLFAGQVISLTTWWLSRAVSGGIMLLLAAGLGYAAYEVVKGWTAESEESNAELEQSVFGTDTMSTPGADELDDISDGKSSVNDQELEEELEALIGERKTATNDFTREAE